MGGLPSPGHSLFVYLFTRQKYRSQLVNNPICIVYVLTTDSNITMKTRGLLGQRSAGSDEIVS